VIEDGVASPGIDDDEDAEAGGNIEGDGDGEAR